MNKRKIETNLSKINDRIEQIKFLNGRMLNNINDIPRLKEIIFKELNNNAVISPLPQENRFDKYGISEIYPSDGINNVIDKFDYDRSQGDTRDQYQALCEWVNVEFTGAFKIDFKQKDTIDFGKWWGYYHNSLHRNWGKSYISGLYSDGRFFSGFEGNEHPKGNYSLGNMVTKESIYDKIDSIDNRGVLLKGISKLIGDIPTFEMWFDRGFDWETNFIANDWVKLFTFRHDFEIKNKDGDIITPMLGLNPDAPKHLLYIRIDNGKGGKTQVKYLSGRKIKV